MKIIIGKTGFEPATPWSQTKCSTKLSYFPGYEVKVIKKDYRIKKKLTCTFLKLSQSLNYAPKGSRTPNLLIRSQTLYPVELWVLNIKQCRGPESNRYGDHSPQDFKSCASASSATPARLLWQSGKRGSNPRPPPWQGGALPLSYFRVFKDAG